VLLGIGIVIGAVLLARRLGRRPTKSLDIGTGTTTPISVPADSTAGREPVGD
jgi:hypothetical protein